MNQTPPGVLENAWRTGTIFLETAIRTTVRATISPHLSSNWTTDVANWTGTDSNDTRPWLTMFESAIGGSDAAALNLSLTGQNASSYNAAAAIAAGDDDALSPATVPRELRLVVVVLVSCILGLIIIATVVGNVFVIAAIFMERNLRSVGNYLVLSLGVADLMVACLVMPLAAVAEVSREWVLGPALCDVWTCCDVLCCTASILHLLAIAMDRYRTVAQVDYVRQRNARQVGLMILLVWAVAVAVSVAPVFGWKDPDFQHRVQVNRICLVSQDVGYQIFATCATFYVPLILILLLYWRIYQVARRRIRHKPGSKIPIAMAKSPSSNVEISVIVAGENHSPNSCSGGTTTQESDVSRNNDGAPLRPALHPSKDRKQQQKQPHFSRESLESKRERKAAKTLAIITGVFVVCWMPFFVNVLLMTLCTSCSSSGYAFSVFLWLGYVNSMLNPIIYTIFSPDFRNAFRKLLCTRKPTYEFKR
ncbi:5-hydroxytryptamine receptor-like [Dermacentor albipictus]|uniref:5-hydroxytryptamine receptor-like n=1 Tax=Dermacentor albipictus TaxID=60249 RepID=UPI0031FC250B